MSSVKNPLSFIGQGNWEVPDPYQVATDEGLIALSWELNPGMYDRLYPHGIFPWFEQDGVVFWFSPPVRSVTPVRGVKVAKSMRSLIHSRRWRFSVNTAFDQVVQHCAEVDRKGQHGTWISEKFQGNFSELARTGRAYSFEVWEGEELIGGTFGVATGRVFVGESMFHTRTNASKFAYIGMCQYLEKRGFLLVDNQLPTEHLDSLGAENWPREDYLIFMAEHSKPVSAPTLETVHDFQLRIPGREA